MDQLFGQYERGASIVEMLLVVPVLFLLIYGVMELNHRIELLQVSQVAVRNSLSIEIQDDYRIQAQEITRGATQTLNQYKSLADSEVKVDSTRVEVEERKRRVMTSHIVGDSFESVSSLESYASKVWINVDDFKSSLRIGRENFFPRDEVYRIEQSIFERDLEDGLYKKIMLSADMAMRSEDGLEDDWLSHRSSQVIYFRPQAGYLETGYKYQALAGIGLGLGSDNRKWSASGDSLVSAQPKKFVSDCIMSFKSGDNCDDRNMLAPLLSTILVIKGVIQGVVDIVSFGSSIGARKAMEQGAKVLKRKLVQSGVEKIQSEIKKKAHDLQPAFEGFKEGYPFNLLSEKHLESSRFPREIFDER